MLEVFCASAYGQDAAHAWLAPTALAIEDIPQRVLPYSDNEALYLEEVSQRRTGRAPRFARTIEVDVQPRQSGSWEQLPDGRSVWRYRVASPGAYSLNLGFEKFQLPEGAVFLMYDPGRERVFGPFTPADHEAHGTFWSPLLEGDALVLEAQLPAHAKREELGLQLRYINHDFAGITRLFSGSCNIDVVCGAADGVPELDAFRDVIQSVANYTVEGKYHCTGFLVNNTAGDCRPLFLTARHCEVDSSNASTVVVYWNYQNSTCRAVNSTANGRPGNGSLNLYNIGTVFRAAWAPADMTLLELDDPVRPEANAFFAGWNADTLMPPRGVASIHHPSSEEKRFSFSTKSVYRGSWGRGALQVANGDHLIVPSWDMGVTEDGSSGGPLFNARQQAIGHLHGGAAACGNQAFDAFGWVAASWEGGRTPKTQLRAWLDPLNSGAKSMSGRWESRCRKSLVADSVSIQLCAGSSGTFLLRPNSGFLKDTRLSVSGASGFQFSIDNPIVKTGTNARLTVHTSPGLPPARYPVTIRATDGEDTILLLLAVDVRNAPGAVRNPFPENGAQLVPIRPRLTWAPLPGVDSFRITLSQDPSFSASDRTTRVARDTTVLLDTLRFGATYYWRIEGLNGCGAGSQTIFSFRTTPDLRLELSALPAEACQGSALSFRLFVGAGFQPPVTLEGKLENGALLPLRTVPAGSTAQPGSWTEVRIDDLSLLTKGVNTLIFSARDGQTAAQHIEKLTLVTAPDAPALLRPLPDTAFLLTQPMLSWGTGAGASAYIVEVSRSAGFEAMVQSYNTGTALQRRLSPLPAGAFFWRVKSANLCGTNLSETRMFSIHTGNISTMNTLQVAIDPNPGDGLFQVLISDPVNEFRMDLYNMAGQHLQRIETQPAQTSWRLDLSRYPEGVYVLRLQHRLASLSRRIVIQRP